MLKQILHEGIGLNLLSGRQFIVTFFNQDKWVLQAMKEQMDRADIMNAIRELGRIKDFELSGQSTLIRMQAYRLFVKTIIQIEDCSGHKSALASARGDLSVKIWYSWSVYTDGFIT